MAFALTVKRIRSSLHLSYSVYRSLRHVVVADRGWKPCTLCALQTHSVSLEAEHPSQDNSAEKEKKDELRRALERDVDKEGKTAWIDAGSDVKLNSSTKDQLHKTEWKKSLRYDKQKELSTEQPFRHKRWERIDFDSRKEPGRNQHTRSQLENLDNKTNFAKERAEKNLYNTEYRRSDNKQRFNEYRHVKMKDKDFGERTVSRNSPKELREGTGSSAKFQRTDAIKESGPSHASSTADAGDSFGNFSRRDVSFLRGEFSPPRGSKTALQPDEAEVFGNLARKEEVTLVTNYRDFKEKDKRFEEPDFEAPHRPLKDEGKYPNSWFQQKIKEFGKKGMVKEAIEVIDVWMLQRERIKPTIRTFNELLHVLARAGYTEKAFKIYYEQMLVWKVKPDKATYSALFFACVNCPQPEEDGVKRARILWQRCERRNIKLNMTVHINAIMAFAVGNDLQMALAVADEAWKKFNTEKETLVSAVLKGVHRDRKDGCLHAIAIWRMFSSKGPREFKPDIYLYNNLLNAIRIGGISSAEKFQQMLKATAYKGASNKFSRFPQNLHSKSGAPRIIGSSSEYLSDDLVLQTGQNVQGALPSGNRKSQETENGEKKSSHSKACVTSENNVTFENKGPSQYHSEDLLDGRVKSSPRENGKQQPLKRSIEETHTTCDASTNNNGNNWLQEVLDKEVLSNMEISSETKLKWWQVAELEEKRIQCPPVPQTRGVPAPQTHGVPAPQAHGVPAPQTHGLAAPHTHGVPAPQTHGLEAPEASRADPLGPPSDILIEENFPDILNPMETLSDVVSISDMKKSEDRINLFGGVKGFLLKMDMDSVAPDIRIFGQLMYVAPKTSEAEQALFKYMEDKGVKPDLEFLNYVIWRRCDRKDFEGARAVLDLISKHGMVPNIKTHTCLIKTCTNNREALDHLQQMLNNGMQPDLATFKELVTQNYAKINAYFLWKVIKTMKDLNMRPDKQFISMMEFNILLIQEIADQNTFQTNEDDLKRIREDHEKLKTYYSDWLQDVELKGEEHPWKAFQSQKDSPKAKAVDRDLDPKTLPC